MSLETMGQHILADETCVSNSRARTQRFALQTKPAPMANCGNCGTGVPRPEHMDAGLSVAWGCTPPKHGTVEAIKQRTKTALLPVV